MLLFFCSRWRPDLEEAFFSLLVALGIYIHSVGKATQSNGTSTVMANNGSWKYALRSASIPNLIFFEASSTMRRELFVCRTAQIWLLSTPMLILWEAWKQSAAGHIWFSLTWSSQTFWLNFTLEWLKFGLLLPQMLTVCKAWKQSAAAEMWKSTNWSSQTFWLNFTFEWLKFGLLLPQMLTLCKAWKQSAAGHIGFLNLQSLSHVPKIKKQGCKDGILLHNWLKNSKIQDRQRSFEHFKFSFFMFLFLTSLAMINKCNYERLWKNVSKWTSTQRVLPYVPCQNWYKKSHFSVWFCKKS